MPVRTQARLAREATAQGKVLERRAKKDHPPRILTPVEIPPHLECDYRAQQVEFRHVCGCDTVNAFLCTHPQVSPNPENLNIVLLRTPQKRYPGIKEYPVCSNCSLRPGGSISSQMRDES